MKEMHALLPRLISEVGHIFHYHLAVQKALHLIGWKYTAYVPVKTEIATLPSGWKRALANDLSEKPKTLAQKMAFFLKSTTPYRAIFKHLEKNESALVFIEHFELPHLAAIAISLALLRPKFSFWILHRYELENRKLKAFFNRLFLAYLRRKLGQNKVKCLTDSDLLAQSLEKDLKTPFSVVPIPHAETKEEPEIKQQQESIRFWWPGGLIREDKGLSKIGCFLSLLKGRKEIQVVMAEKAEKFFGQHSHIEYIPTILPREEYINWMQRADIILLPYSGNDYALRTSGIFVEAIAFGGLPIVTKGSWMAYELNRFQLDELTFTWEEPDLLSKIEELLKDTRVKGKLAKMNAYYRGFHCLSGFSAVLEKIDGGTHD